MLGLSCWAFRSDPNTEFTRRPLAWVHVERWHLESDSTEVVDVPMDQSATFQQMMLGTAFADLADDDVTTDAWS